MFIKYVYLVDDNQINKFTDVASSKADNRENLNKTIQESIDKKGILDRLSRGGFEIAVHLDEDGVKFIESDNHNDGLLKDIKLFMARD